MGQAKSKGLRDHGGAAAAATAATIASLTLWQPL